MSHRIICLMLLGIVTNLAFADPNISMCPDGTKTTVQLKNLAVQGQHPNNKSILGELYLFDMRSGIENYPGISGVCEAQGTGYKLLGQFYNGFSARPDGSPWFSAFLCCGIEPNPCADDSGGGSEGRCGPGGTVMTSGRIILPFPKVQTCAQAETYLSQSNLMKEFRQVYLQCQNPSSQKPQTAKKAKFLDLVGCADGSGVRVEVSFEYCCSNYRAQITQMKQRK